MPRKWLVGALLVGACAFLSSAFAADKAPFERIVVFGTSLVTLKADPRSRGR